MIKVGIVDYGVGNLASLQGALSRLGARARAVTDEAGFADVDCMLLPGVGSAAFAMARLRETGLDRFIRARFDAQDLPIIGICLGMQLMFEYSEEGDTNCLGLLPGRVHAFDRGDCHVGWNIVRATDKGAHLPPVQAYYFNHSYWVDCPAEITLATADYRGNRAAVVGSGLCHGIQFHPEKSQMVGQALLRHLIFEPEKRGLADA